MNGRVLSVLATDPVARHVAQLLGLRVVEPGERPPGAVLIVVHRPETIDAVRRVIQNLDVAGIVAWSLPERATLQLLDTGVPVVVGQPTPDELRSLAWWGEAPDPIDVTRERTDRLARLEDVF
jgi:hypothetical protein